MAGRMKEVTRAGKPNGEEGELCRSCHRRDYNSAGKDYRPHPLTAAGYSPRNRRKTYQCDTPKQRFGGKKSWRPQEIIATHEPCYERGRDTTHSIIRAQE